MNKKEINLGIEMSDEELIDMVGGFDATQPIQPPVLIQPKYGIVPKYGITPKYGIVAKYGIQPLYGIKPMEPK